MTTTFRTAGAGDLPAVRALIEGAYRGDAARGGWTHEADLLTTPRTDAATLAAIVADADDLLLLAEEGGTLVGCVQVTRRLGRIAYVGMLTVDPARQAGGLGKRILATAEAIAAERYRADTIELSVVSLRSELIAYYERRGYRATGERRPFPEALEPPLVLMVMTKRLDPASSFAPSRG